MADALKLLAVLVVVSLIFYMSYKTVSYGQRNLHSLIHSRGSLLIARISMLVVGALIGLLLSLVTLRVSTTHAIVGLPLPWAIWENVDGHWQDFGSPLSVVPWCVDLIFGLTLSHIPAATVCFVRKLRHTQGAI
jgi:hypothetical protein